MDIVILMLAAGSGRRFGGDKRQALLADGTPILQRSTTQALASGLSVKVCLRPQEAALAEQLLALGAEILVCPQAALGMAYTLAAGVAHCEDSDGVLVALGDMPEVRSSSFTSVANALRPEGICQPHWHGRPGHPVGFSRAYFDALKLLSGDGGASPLIREHQHAVTRLPLDDPGIIFDIDRPSDIPQH